MTTIETVKKAAREAQHQFERRHLPTVQVTLEVPIDAINLSECECIRYWVPAGEELGGSISRGQWAYECDLFGATFEGRQVLVDELSDTDTDRLEQRLIEERYTPPEAA